MFIKEILSIGCCCSSASLHSLEKVLERKINPATAGKTFFVYFTIVFHLFIKYSAIKYSTGFNKIWVWQLNQTNFTMCFAFSLALPPPSITRVQHVKPRGGRPRRNVTWRTFRKGAFDSRCYCCRDLPVIAPPGGMGRRRKRSGETGGGVGEILIKFNFTGSQFIRKP